VACLEGFFFRLRILFYLPLQMKKPAKMAGIPT
jgi:hypothetical protein